MQWDLFKTRSRFRLPLTENQFLAELVRTKGEDDSVVYRRVADLLFRMRLRRAIERRLWMLKAVSQTARSWIKSRLGKLVTRIHAFDIWLIDKLKQQVKKNEDGADHHDH